MEVDDGGGEIQIDFLSDLIGIPKHKALKGRLSIGTEVSEDGGVYVLSEMVVLTNRVMNTLRLAKYQSPHGVDQVYNAMAVVKAAIKSRLDADMVPDAARLMHCVLDLAKQRSIGVALYVKFGIDLLDALVVEDARFPRPFSGCCPTLN